MAKWEHHNYPNSITSPQIFLTESKNHHHNHDHEVMNPPTYDPSVTTRLDDDPRSWAPMDPELKKAACAGNVKFLRKAIASAKPQDYWLSRFRPTRGRESCAGNILHLAVWNNRKTFVTQALYLLGEEDVILRQLLTQRETAAELSNATPALLAIKKRRVGCAKILTEGSRAELIKNLLDGDGNSPLFLAVQNGLPEVVLNLLRCQRPLSCRGPTGSTALHILPELSLYSGEYL
uniref:Uncharacterized protein n=8 Tax=Opuntia streptacantha TaxID=393608 RepID=A0A7C8ZJV7_OPUST